MNKRVPGNEYFEMYGVIASSIEGVLLKVSGSKLILIRVFGFILNILTSWHLYQIGKLWLSNNWAAGTSLIWLSMNPVWTSFLQDNQATAQTWPNQYGVLLALIVLRIIVSTPSISKTNQVFIAVSITCLPFIRIQFAIHAMVFLILLFYFKKISSITVFAGSLCISLVAIVLLFFKNLKNLDLYFSNMFETQSSLRPTLYSGLVKYYLGYLELSVKISICSFILFLIFFSISLLPVNRVTKCKSPLSSFILVIPVFSLILYVANNPGFKFGSEIRYIDKGLYWCIVIYQKLPHLLLYLGLLISVILGAALLFSDKQKKTNICFVTGISLANMGLLYDIPDIGRFWSGGVLFLLIAVLVIRKTITRYQGSQARKLVFSTKCFIFLSLSGSLLGMSLFAFTVSRYEFRLEQGPFQGMLISPDQKKEMEALTTFTQKLSNLEVYYGESAEIFCNSGFAHIFGGRIMGNSPFWQRYEENRAKLESIKRSSSKLIGACELSNFEKRRILDIFGSQAEFIKDSVIIDRRNLS
jgi:hypothetical protein